jgi:hypothetical protein
VKGGCGLPEFNFRSAVAFPFAFALGIMRPAMWVTLIPMPHGPGAKGEHPSTGTYSKSKFSTKYQCSKCEVGKKNQYS